MLRRDGPTAVGLAGAAMSISASLFALVLPGSVSIGAVFLRAVPFAPIGAICALITWHLRGGRALSVPHRTVFICIAAVLGGFLGALLDLAITALRPDIGPGVTGGDVIIGAATGALAGHIGALKPIVRT
jgi:hypothetical protein